MVTHNNELACQTPRRIVVRNGMIELDGPCGA
jgi:predicted ABC-type transport system involved in lysophospholipase L1 biosynthesis ATPase subunit